MTYNRYKSLVEMMLNGDFPYPTDEEASLGVLAYSLEHVANNAQATRLRMTREDSITKEREIVRMSNPENYVIVRPFLPVNDTDEIEMDDGLMFAVARVASSLMSGEKYQWHMEQANEIMRRYDDNILALAEDGRYTND